MQYCTHDTTIARYRFGVEMTKLPLYRTTHKHFDKDFVRIVIESLFEAGGIGADATCYCA